MKFGHDPEGCLDCDWQEYTAERVVQAQQSTGWDSLGLVLRDPRMTSLALWRDVGRRNGKGFRSDAVEGSYSRGVFFHLFQ